MERSCFHACCMVTSMQEKKAMTRLDHIADQISAVMIGLCIMIFTVMVFAVSYGVVGRYIPFIKNPRWTQELAILCMVWICFVSSGHAIKNGLHVRMSLLNFVVPKKVASSLHRLAYVLLLVVNIFWIVFGTQLTHLTSTARMPSTGWPLCLTYLSVVVGGFYGAAMALYRLVKGGF